MAYSGHSTPCFYPSATTKNAIIDAFARDKKMKREIENICRCKEIDDLMQIIYLYLLEMKEETIIELNETKKLKYFIIRMVLNQINSTTSLYYRQYVRNSFLFDEELMGKTDSKDWNVNELNDVVTAELQKLPFYYRKIFEMVADNPDKTFPQLAKQYKIKSYSIFYTYAKVRKILKKSIRKRGL